MSRSNTLQRIFLRLFACRAAVATIEFAILFPFLFLMVFGGIEVGRLLLIQQRLERAGYVIADITTQYMPATATAASNEINKAKLINDVFPQFSRIMNPYGNPAQQAIIITSVERTGANKRIRWQISSAANSLSGCDTATPTTCVTSIVNGLAPGAITTGVKDTLTNFPADIESLMATMPDGSNTIVVESFYSFQPILQTLLQNVGAVSGFNFFVKPRIYVKRVYMAPRNGVMRFLPPDFPVS